MAYSSMTKSLQTVLKGKTPFDMSSKLMEYIGGKMATIRFI